MPYSSPRSDESSSNTGETLTDRVLARVRTAAVALEPPAGAPAARPRRHARPGRLSPAAERTAEQVREARSLRLVFTDLGSSYRDYRRRTGAEVSTDVKDAACRFRRQLDLASLVAVAASLDRLEALPW
jgi:hypothetical protein